MLQSLRNRRNRKGFTLAELLIVVAIIAVLVAIAVPLFVGALDDAKQKVYLADARSIKSLAVKEILMDDDAYAKKGAKGWKVTGTVKENGDVSITEIVGAAAGDADSTWTSTYKAGDDITVIVDESAVNFTKGS